MKINGRKIPLVMIGSSPFIGAGQFSFKGLLWRRKFLKNAMAMAELMERSYEVGGGGAHVIPEGEIPNAVRMVREEYPDFKVIGSTLPYKVKEGIKELASLDAEIIFLHGEISDSRDEGKILELFDEIRGMGSLPGIASHNNPPKTIEFLLRRGIDAPVLLPFNKLGYAMNGKTELEQMIDTCPLNFIGMKTLAAGRLKPREALEYVSRHKIRAVTIGAVTEDEVKETFSIALHYLGAKGDALEEA